MKKLVSELKKGEHYEISCEADGKTDGKFKIQLKLSDEMKTKLEKEWTRKLKFTVEEGTLTVKNKYGSWDGEKFKKKDGSYAKNEFIPYEGNRYYFGEDGKKVTGELKLNGKMYTFSKSGKLKSEEFYVDPEKPMIALTFDEMCIRDRDEDVVVEFGNNKNCRIPMQTAAIAQVEKPSIEG